MLESTKKRAIKSLYPQSAEEVMDLSECFSVGINPGYFLSSHFAVARFGDFIFLPEKIISKYKLHIAWSVSSTEDFRFFGSTVSE